IEAIGGEIVTAAQQLELPGRGANVKDALLSADRAVAFAHGRLLQVDADAEPHRPQWQPPSYVCSISLLPCRSTLFRLSFWGSSAHNPRRTTNEVCKPYLWPPLERSRGSDRYDFKAIVRTWLPPRRDRRQSRPASVAPDL